VDTALQLVRRILTNDSFDTLKATEETLRTIDENLLRHASVAAFVPDLIDRLKHESWAIAASAAEVSQRSVTRGN